MTIAAQVARFIRWRDWASGTFALLWTLSLYAVVAYDLSITRFALTFIILIFFAACQSAFAYVINDWSDRQLDRRLFRGNAFNGMSPLEGRLALALIATAAVISGIILIPKPGFINLWLAWLLAALAYSLEPLRLKERGLAGTLAVVAARWFLPVLLVFAVFQVAGGRDMWLLAAGFGLHGAAQEMRRKRRQQGESGRAKRLDGELSREAAALLVNRLALGLILGMSLRAVWQSQPKLGYFLAALFGAAYLFLLPGALVWARRAFSGDGAAAEAAAGRWSPHQLDSYLMLSAPLALGVAAVWRSPDYGIFLGLLLAWFVAYRGTGGYRQLPGTSGT